MKDYAASNAAIFCGTFGTHRASNRASIIVKTKEDLQLVERMIEIDKHADFRVKYDSRAKKILSQESTYRQKN